MAEHWLRFMQSDMCWGLFSENGNGTMRVLAHIDQSTLWNYPELPRPDARDRWTRLLAMGWHHAPLMELEAAGMSVYKLNIICLPAKYKGAKAVTPAPHGNGHSPSRRLDTPPQLVQAPAPRRPVVVERRPIPQRPRTLAPQHTGNDPGPWNGG